MRFLKLLHALVMRREVRVAIIKILPVLVDWLEKEIDENEALRRIILILVNQQFIEEQNGIDMLRE